MRFIFLLLCLYSSTTLSLPSGVSAIRPNGISWQELARERKPLHLQHFRGTVINNAVPLPEVDTNQITRWKSYAEIEAAFQKGRDLRFLEDPDVKNNQRRSSWLYPDDGCYARASLLKNNVTLMGQPPPSKIFVMGDLWVKTNNALWGGGVSWWYHVAPIVTDGAENYVLDPAIEPNKPLPLQEWLKKMGKPSAMKISICAPTSYTPYSDCLQPDSEEDSSAETDQSYFLSLERDRLVDLNRNDEEELGDHPPWMVSFP